MSRGEFVDGRRWPSGPGAGTPEAVPLSDRTATPAPLPASPREGSGEQLPDSLTALLHTPDVWVQADEARCAVVICLPSHLARALAPLAPDPTQVQLAAHLVEAAEMDAADRRELLEETSRV